MRIAGQYTTARCKLDNTDTGARVLYPGSSLASPPTPNRFRPEDDQRKRRFFLALQPAPRNALAGAVRLAAASASFARSVGELLPYQRRDETRRSYLKYGAAVVVCEVIPPHFEIGCTQLQNKQQPAPLDQRSYSYLSASRLATARNRSLSRPASLAAARLTALRILSLSRIAAARSLSLFLLVRA